MYDGRDDLLVEPAWNQDPPTVYIDTPYGATVDDLGFAVTDDGALYITCEDETATARYADAADDIAAVVEQLLDLPGALTDGGHRDAATVPLPDDVLDAPGGYRARATANNGVVTLEFADD